MQAQSKPIAYVLLTDTGPLTTDLLHRTVSLWVADRRPGNVVKGLARDSSFAPGGMILMVGACPMLLIPIEHKLADGTVLDDSAQNHACPGWREAFDRHAAHLIVMPLLRPEDAAGDAKAHAKWLHEAARNTFDIASALCGLDEAVGAYWAPAKLFHESEAFAERRAWRRKSSAELLIRLRWFSETVSGHNEIGACTTGLAAFCGRELLHPPSREEPSEIYGRVLSVCSQLIERGAPPLDGDCVGRGSADRVGLVFDETARGERVIRMEIERLEYA